jgi:hypothetical protein
MDMIQVFEAVRSEQGEIVDFSPAGNSPPQISPRLATLLKK